MSVSINKVTLIGYLGCDPEVRYTPSAVKIVTLSVATTEIWKDKTTGERREKTEWHRIIIHHNKLADIAEKYLQKGSRVYLEGQLQTRKWTNGSGREQYLTEIILSSYKSDLTVLDGKLTKAIDSPPYPANDQDPDSSPSALEDALSQSDRFLINRHDASTMIHSSES